MEQRKISENQRDILSLKIAEIVLSLNYDENVQCIFFETFYDENNKERNFMKLHILCKNPNEFAYRQNINDFNSIDKEGHLYNDFGLNVQIGIESDQLVEYNSLLELCEASILLDRTGEFTKLKREITENRSKVLGEKFLYNQTEVKPSLETGIKSSIQELKKIMGK